MGVPNNSSFSEQFAAGVEYGNGDMHEDWLTRSIDLVAEGDRDDDGWQTVKLTTTTKTNEIEIRKRKEHAVVCLRRLIDLLIRKMGT